MNRQTKMAVALASAVLLLIAVWYVRGSYTPSGQPPLTVLGQDNLNQFHAAFDAGASAPRLLLLFSPT
jgi:hypothetical protein